ncbi:hypothetical protein GCM10022403_006730 [Streptomyces coacervatus]|uniref:Lipoprotein n=1 Tax=Streptomyces coacervatus TaxID=647381 RepID=A0ABP7GUL6_9ACTN|nr:hypothetical protein [Streptomyces coacervatus]MDF2272661.1 hypothetical protein [Streptomyces coacervatus]
MRRAVAAVLCAVAGSVLLTGCTPTEKHLIAIWLDGRGQPVARVRPCGDDRVSGAELLSWVTDGGGSADYPGEGWRSQAPEGFGGATFPLFAPPRSWRVRRTGTQSFVRGRSYKLSFVVHGDDSTKYASELLFSGDDLTSLKPGQVWAEDQPLSREDWDDLVGEQC